MNFLKTYWKSILLVAVILFLSLWRKPTITMPDVRFADKWAHIAMFAALAFVLRLDLYAAGKGAWQKCVWGLAFSVLLGGLIEVLQEKFFKPRTGDWLDWLADCLGALVGFVLFPLACHLWKRIFN